MHVRLDVPAPVPSGEQYAAVTAVMFDVLERVHHVRDEAQAAGEAEGDGCPGTNHHIVSRSGRRIKGIADR